MNRRDFLALGATGLSTTLAGSSLAHAGDLTPDWTSLAARWRVPEWFRDAKFGIWAHWSAQCVPELGDWYGRFMYVEGSPAYRHHLEHYGHPADRGFMEIENLWKAENWDPHYLVRRYRNAGARYFMALACHHDNLDTFASSHHAWNTLRVGPRRDIIGTWEKAARAEGLRFGVSNHASHAWHWWQTAYGYDTRGPRKGERYDAFRLRREQGAGTWWEGLDPQDLYTGGTFVPPDGIDDPEAMAAWHEARDGQWDEARPRRNPAFARNWLLRQKELVEKYRPDLVYMDDYGLPFDRLGLAAAAHYYAQASAWHGSADVVLTAKRLDALQRRALVEDVERGFSDRLRDEPWQTCTCIGDWHYSRARFDDKSYVPAEQVIQRLVDTIAKNGNLLLSIPMRGDGTIDSEEEAIVDAIGAWMAVHGEAVHGSRPWRAFGEGPTQVAAGMKSEDKAVPFTARDVRYTVKSTTLFAFFLRWPDAPVTLELLGLSAMGGARVERATLLGGGDVGFVQDTRGLTLTLPAPDKGQIVPAVRLEGRGLV